MVKIKKIKPMKNQKCRTGGLIKIS
jgi:hypothetical protein